VRLIALAPPPGQAHDECRTPLLAPKQRPAPHVTGHHLKAHPVTALLVPLVLFAIVVVFTPGANNILAATAGAQFGLRASTRLLFGLGLGVVSLVIVTAVGLGSLIRSTPELQSVLKIVGSAYLLWLAMKIGRSGRPSLGEPAGTSLTFRAGLLVSWLNPKTWMLGISVASGYSALSSNPVVLAAILGTVFAMVVAPNLMMWCKAGYLIAERLKTDRQWRILNIVLAALLVVSIIPMWLE
jgi:threonine/homoserine/homoserine lactone efflux protein